MEDLSLYIGRRAFGIRFNENDTVYWNEGEMSKKIDVLGIITCYDAHDDAFRIGFSDGDDYYYPAHLIVEQLNNPELLDAHLEQAKAEVRRIEALIEIRDTIKVGDIVEFSGNDGLIIGAVDGINKDGLSVKGINSMLNKDKVKKVINQVVINYVKSKNK